MICACVSYWQIFHETLPQVSIHAAYATAMYLNCIKVLPNWFCTTDPYVTGLKCPLLRIMFFKCIKYNA